VTGGDSAGAIPFFQRAIQIDPNFAWAHLYLGLMYSNVGEHQLSTQAIDRAHRLRDRASEREKLVIDGVYYELVTGNLEKARNTLQLATQTYPRYWGAHNLLGVLWMTLAQPDRAISELRTAIRLNPADAMDYSNLVITYLTSNRVREAEATVEEAKAKGIGLGPSDTLYALAFFQNDTAEMSRQRTLATGRVGEEDLLLALEAQTAAYCGELARAREFITQAADSAQRAGEGEAAATYKAVAALWETLIGNPSEARRRAVLATARSAGHDVMYLTALASAYAGDNRRAEALADDLGKQYPEDTIVRFNYLPTLRGKAALNRANSSQAIESLRAAAPYELATSTMGPGYWTSLYPVYVRGEAYLAAHQGREATLEFQKIIDHRGIVLNEPIGALARLQLGRAYAMSGDTAKAKAAYQDFLALWKDADPDIPVLKEARTEYAKLR
jgi:tetratricopeptide (TPR) repeat protein